MVPVPERSLPTEPGMMALLACLGFHLICAKFTICGTKYCILDKVFVLYAVVNLT